MADGLFFKPPGNHRQRRTAAWIARIQEREKRENGPGISNEALRDLSRDVRRLSHLPDNEREALRADLMRRDPKNADYYRNYQP